MHIKPHRVGFSLQRKNRRVRSEKDNTRSLTLCIIKASSATGRYTIILYYYYPSNILVVGGG